MASYSFLALVEWWSWADWEHCWFMFKTSYESSESIAINVALTSVGRMCCPISFAKELPCIDKANSLSINSSGSNPVTDLPPHFQDRSLDPPPCTDNDSSYAATHTHHTADSLSPTEKSVPIKSTYAHALPTVVVWVSQISKADWGAILLFLHSSTAQRDLPLLS